MRKYAVITTLCVIALFAVPLGAAATGGGQAAASSVTCPLPSAPGAFVVDISSELMLAWTDAGRSTAGPVPLELPAGTWDVYLTSYDDHSHKTDQHQKKEEWFLQGRLGTTVVFTSPATPDLPESSDIESFYMGSLTTSQAIDNVLAVHAAYPDPVEPHSVAPLCAAFYPSGAAPIAPAACPIPAGPGVVVISAELMLAWDADLATAGPVDFALPAGTWDVILVSYDRHSAKTYQNQKQEQWYLQGLAGGSVVFVTGTTPDLPEDADYGYFPVGLVTNAVPIDQVKAVHAAYPSDEPHSVAPLCAAFVAQGTTPTTGGTTTTPTSGATSPTTGGTTTTPTSGATSPTTGGTTTKPTSGSGDTSSTSTTGGTSPTGGTTSNPTTGGGATTATTGGSGVSDAGGTATTVGAGLEGNTAQSLQQLPLTGVELETAFAAIVALMFGIVLLRRAREWQSRLDRRAARAYRRQLS